ncbi:SdrD B-like domain-containing protein [Anatilimnocola floriformis]|uniref:SdrD B-like domain-containing protein n=1 Tax=Anatilimnocola floriformis TaxID=2948575 RepID=UPI0020C41D2F|nr:SdrD B-like domain-containing protein [Anatilimnocola floriformis]
MDGYVWQDANYDGLQQSTENGLAGVVVELYATINIVPNDIYDDSRIAVTTTDADGRYSFGDLVSGKYFVVVHPPVNYSFTVANVGTDDTIDSDFTNVSVSTVLTVQAFEHVSHVDLGLLGTSPKWGFALRAGTTTDDTGIAVASDTDGNIFVAGQFTGTIDLDTGPLQYNLTTFGTDTDVFLAKYTPAGALIWARKWGDSDDESLADIKVDSQGNVVVAGRFGYSLDLDPGLNSTLRVKSSSWDDVFIVKLDPLGNYLWGGNMGGTSDETAAALTIDSNDNVYLAGNFSGTADVNPGLSTENTPIPANYTPLTSAGSYDAFVIKLTEIGDLVWARSFGGTGDDGMRDLDVDAAGNVILTGYFSGVADFNPAAGTGSVFNLTSAGSFDSYVLKLNDAGNFVLALRQGNTGADQDSNSISVDSAGNIYTVGGFQGTVNFDPMVAGAQLSSAGGLDIFVAKRDALGKILWVKRYGSGATDVAYGVDTDADGNVYLTGRFGNTVEFGDVDTRATLTSSNGSSDSFITTLTPSGETFSAFRIGSGLTDQGNGIAFDQVSRSIVSTGKFSVTPDFDVAPTTDYPLTSAGGTDMYLSVFRKNFAPRFVNLSSSTIYESQLTQIVGTISVVDDNQGDQFTYELLDNLGGKFSLVGNQLIANSALIDFQAESSFRVNVRATDLGGLSAPGSFTVEVVPKDSEPILPPVIGFEQTTTGFTLDFSRDLDPTTLNLYLTQGSNLGPVDLVLRGSASNAEPIRGSAVISPDRRRLTFIATASILPADIYTVTLGTSEGGKFVRSFGVATPLANAVKLSLPNFSRGPAQMVNVPAKDDTAGIPISVSNAAGITSAVFQLRYDPALLNIQGIAVAPGMPTGATASLVITTPGLATITFASTTPLTIGAKQFVTLQASVPSTATYRAKHILDLTNISLNSGAIPAIDDDALHVVAYFADVTGNGAYSAQDASLVARNAVGIDTGLQDFPLLDPVVIGDITGNGSFSGDDTSLILQAAVGIFVDKIPGGVFSGSFLQGGPDPKLSIPRNLSASPGQTLNIPVDIDSIVDLTGSGLSSGDLVIYYDPQVLDVTDVALGSLLSNRSDWMISSRINPLAGRIDITLAGTRPIEGRFRGEFVKLQATVRAGATTGASAINIAANSRSRQTQLNEGGLTLIPAPTDASNDAIDGLLTVISAAAPPEVTARVIDGRLLITGTNAAEQIFVGYVDAERVLVRSGRRLLGTFVAPQGIAIDGVAGNDLVYVDPRLPATVIQQSSIGADHDLIFAADNSQLIETELPPSNIATAAGQQLSNQELAILQILANWRAEYEIVSAPAPGARSMAIRRR